MQGDRFPEEQGGVAGMMRARADAIEKVAHGCEAEAREAEERAASLRVRAEGLREHVTHYRSLAKIAETGGAQ